jgi:hypothetical protein
MPGGDRNFMPGGGWDFVGQVFAGQEFEEREFVEQVRADSEFGLRQCSASARIRD